MALASFAARNENGPGKAMLAHCQNPGSRSQTDPRPHSARKNISPLLLGLLLLAAPEAQAQFLVYSTNADGVSLSVTKYYDYGSYAAVTIPATNEGLPVTGIGYGAFSASFLTNVVIPSGVISIGDYAFFCCQLQSLTLPGSIISIGADAFHDCIGLTSVTIPGGVTSIGDYAFAGNRLTNVAIPASITNLGEAPFGSSPLTAITVEAANLFYSSVNGVLFDKNQDTLVEYPGGRGGGYTIPGGVTSIGASAFSGTGLTSITIPGGVTNIGAAAFAACPSLPAITVDAQNSFYIGVNGVLFNKTQTALIQYPGAMGGSYTIPGSVTNIQEDAFLYCTKLTNVTIGTNVTSIGAYAFDVCTGLTGITIPASVTDIGVWAFNFCTSLASITIPGSLTNIGEEAFGYCSSLTNIYFTGNAPAADSTVFDSDGNATVYYWPGASGWSSTFAGLPAVLWNPVIQTGDGSFGVKNGQFGFNVTGTANIPVVVESCTNLACPVWSPLRAVTLTNGSFYFSEAAQANGGGRFYRIGSP